MNREEEVLADAKRVMDEFFEALSQAKVTVDEFGLERTPSTRSVKGRIFDPDFKDAVLENAPQKNQDYIIAEKKHW